ncbi:MAG: hypothetical protein HC886_21235 [Leptolyngbyaceae cyanobacterium SM1_1_3]|nr:hypothetical protein [Leptolyngbyaceae cyanobacterium SM1_1_3]NJN01065.1 hypothetical protein [Leptolyngbyaceae cyanobacterium RM1_1_2]NJO11868.1 hypothetical protein [Leptolyngbyaceae cyanobacterium SL_1_1]
MTGYTRYTHESQLDLNRKQLEKTLSRPQPRPAQNAIAQLLAQAGTTLLNLMTHGDQPRISVREVNGAEIWHAYDPVSNRRAVFNSEEALRSWLEDRYYQ